MYSFYDFDDIHEGHVDVYSGGRFEVSHGYARPLNTKGKWAVFKGLNDDYPQNIISETVYYNECEPGDYNSVFISSKSKLSRDVVRRSYKITRNPDTIDCVTVIPNKYSGTFTKYNLALINKTSQIITLYKFNKQYLDDKDTFPDNVIEDIKTFIETLEKRKNANAELEFICAAGGLMNDVSFMFKCDEYKDIILNTYPNREYVLDTEVVYDPVPIIDVDTLEMWKNMPADLLYKSVASSDWKDYPLTLCVFFQKEKSNLLYKIDPAFTLVYSGIGLDVFSNRRGSAEEYLANRNITAKDWNMLQKWILHSYNLPETGGFIDYEPNEYCDLEYFKFIQNKIALKPMYLQETINGQNLMNLGYCK